VEKEHSKTPCALPGFSDKDTQQKAEVDTSSQKPVEVGGPKGLEPTRYGDWEKAGRCSDF
jgi:hypothetical protein